MISLRLYALFSVACTLTTVASLGAPTAVVGFGTAIAIAFVRIPSFRMLTFLGSISYSLYLTHPLVGGRVVNFSKRYSGESGSSSVQVAILIVAVASSIVAAYFMYKAVERPAQKWASIFSYSAERGS